MLNLLVDLKRELALTYVFISHDLNVVQYMSDRVLVMYLGKVVEIGPVESIYGSPSHPYTRALLGAMPSMDPDRRGEQATLTGDPPNPINPPPGCRFHTRCAHAEACCAAVGAADGCRCRDRRPPRRLPHADTGLRPQRRAAGCGVRRPGMSEARREPPPRRRDVSRRGAARHAART